MAVWDWSARHTPTSGTINITTGLMAASSVAAGHISGEWPMLVAGAGTFGAVISGLARDEEERLTRGALFHRAACWLGAGGWVSFALSQPQPLTVTTVSALAAGGALFGSVSHGLSKRKKRKIAAKDAANAQAELIKSAGEWAERVDRVCSLKGSRVLNLETWANKAGISVEIELPGGATFAQVAGYSDQLASDAALDEGCGIEIGHGIKRNRVILKVSHINALIGIHEIPLDFSPLDFTEDFGIGIERDMTTAQINMRESSAILVGQKRSGKTNEILAIMTQLMRMKNLLVWVIDFNGGGVALPWIHGWNEAGRPGRCPIDWVATNEDEAALMVSAAVSIAKRRKVAYQQLMRKNNTDLLPLSPELPGILLMTDEGAEILGMQNAVGAKGAARRAIAQDYIEVLRIAGSVGVNELTCGLRATADVFGDPMVKKQSRVKIGMMMDDADEIAYLLGWTAKIGPEDMPSQGYGAYQDGKGGPARLFKGWRTLPDHIDKFVVGTASLHPELDEESAKAAGPEYVTRFDRLKEWLDLDALQASGGVVGTVVNEPQEASPAPDPIAAAFDGESDPAALATARREIREAGGEVTDDEEFERIMIAEGLTDWSDPDNWPAEVTPANPDPDDPDDGEEPTEGVDTAQFKMIIFGIVKASGEAGIKPADIVRHLQRSFAGQPVPVVKTVTRWLKNDDRIWQPTGYGFYAVKPKD